MNRFFRCLCRSLLCFILLVEVDLQALGQLECEALFGYRNDQLSWNIAGLNNRPNVLSKLDWKDVKIAQAALSFNGNLPLNIHYRGWGSYGRVLKGRNRDSDYAGNNRTLEFSRSLSSCYKGDVYDASFGVGCPIKAWSFLPYAVSAEVIPLLGISFDKQTYCDRKGVQVINALNPNVVGHFRGLRSRYSASWKGPWVGCDLKVKILNKLKLTASFEFHKVSYKGSGHWNLRRDFAKDFQHRAKGNGFLIALKAVYPLPQKWELSINLSCKSFKSRKGRDRKYFWGVKNRGGGEYAYVPFSVDIRLNQVVWKSYDLMVGLGRRF